MESLLWHPSLHNSWNVPDAMSLQENVVDLILSFAFIRACKCLTRSRLALTERPDQWSSTRLITYPNMRLVGNTAVLPIRNRITGPAPQGEPVSNRFTAIITHC